MEIVSPYSIITGENMGKLNMKPGDIAQNVKAFINSLNLVANISKTNYLCPSS